MTTRKVCAFKTHLSHGHTTGHLNAKSYILSRWNWTTCGQSHHLLSCDWPQSHKSFTFKLKRRIVRE